MIQYRKWSLIILILASCSRQDMADPVAHWPNDEIDPPLEITFKQSCKLPEGRQQVYDPRTGIFHVHFEEPTRIGMRGSGLYKRSAFEVTKIRGPFVKPVVFRLTGVPSNYGCLGDPLSLCVDGRNGQDDEFHFHLEGKYYALVEDPLAQGPVDKTYFRVERQDEVVTVAFTEKGRALLKPGALVSFKLDHGW
jgi:hypothetical protein